VSDEAQEKSKVQGSRRVGFWLAQAERHIEERRYYLARRILESLHDPEIHAMLDRLNAIAPPPSEHRCPVCNFQEFTWHRTVAYTGMRDQRHYLEVNQQEVYSRVCISCGNIQMFVQLPDWAQVEDLNK
jgi:hypothetical protein